MTKASPQRRAARLRVHDDAEAATPATASEQLIRKALQEEIVTDAKGRKLTLRKPSPLAQFRLIEALGETASNEAYMRMANPLLYLAAIDGEPIPVPGTKLEVEALITRLDDEGLAEVMGWYVVNVIMPTQGAYDAAAKAAAEKAALKN